ncbi:MAG: DUF2147 domain-containing protein [Sphingobacteriales bacterium]|nr:MAG: DUF2147 domain-containing protein [Sphingobacteriales bacterium]
MSKILFQRLFLILLSICAFSMKSFGQDPIEGHWFNEEKSAKIQIYKGSNNKFYGKIVWLKEPAKNGKPKTDDLNPDSRLRTRPIVGLVILNGFEKDGNEYEDGTIYDPKNGKTYSCKIKMKGKTLDVRGYVGVSLLGRTTVWTAAD